MANTAKSLTYRGGNRPAESEDSWVAPIRMLYRMTIEVRDAQGTRFFFLPVANFHNAEAIQQVFEGISTIDVSFQPDVLSYLAKVYPNLPIDSDFPSTSDDTGVDLSPLDEEDKNDYL